jgi:hypothetical protein
MTPWARKLSICRMLSNIWQKSPDRLGEVSERDQDRGPIALEIAQQSPDGGAF